MANNKKQAAFQKKFDAAKADSIEVQFHRESDNLSFPVQYIGYTSDGAIIIEYRNGKHNNIKYGSSKELREIDAVIDAARSLLKKQEAQATQYMMDGLANEQWLNGDVELTQMAIDTAEALSLPSNEGSPIWEWAAEVAAWYEKQGAI